ncbi:uncharacterized protein VTP21DRAFT_10906 [Calcarisporiella thermophila]|uniref:uncharacterized protein n=1 Tax=Calcarisporiella thermophila TaxID=911321 RepID=UPI0037433DC0
MRSSKELSHLAEIRLDPNTSLKIVLRSADSLYRQALIYKKENDLENLYLSYMKFSNVILGQLPKNKDFRKEEYKKTILDAKRKCKGVLSELETIKPILDKVYEEKRREAERRRREAIRLQLERQQKEASQQQKEEQTPPTPPPKQKSEWSLQEELKDLQIDDDGVRILQSAKESQNYYPETRRNISDGYTYSPPAQASTSIPIARSPPDLLSINRSINDAVFQPILPPKPNAYREEMPPDLQTADRVVLPPLPPKPTETIIEEPEHVCEATTEGGVPLRSVVVPTSLLKKFLDIAQPNTNKNLETCGILSGTLKRNIFTINTLIIPKQTSTSDTCTTTNEEELFAYQDERDLMTLGWIHTHPTQSCFMSSVDLHTHCSYQLMLPEAIAIVCAPKHKPDYGIFRLTDPPGMDVIMKCTDERLFHPHPDVAIYTDTSGHVKLLDIDFTVIDLRS